MAIDVFVSYHAQTGLEIARSVVQKLEANGLRCWYQERDSGGYYASMITRTVASCGVFVVILSQGATKSKFVKSELAMAFERDRLPILPLRVSADKLSDSATFYLSGLHWIDALERPLDAALEDLCRRTLRALNRSEIPVETIRYDDGCVYTGQVVNGKRNGKGKYTWGKDSQWAGDVYDGDFVNEQFHGKGRYVFRGGCVYEGDYVNGKRTGKGTLTWPSGDIYEGDWRDDKRNGKGTMTLTNGNIYEGDFVDDKLHGKGKYTWGKDSLWAGDVYEGDFVDGKFNGIGTYTYADGRVESGRWKDGKFLG